MQMLHTILMRLPGRKPPIQVSQTDMCRLSKKATRTGGCLGTPG